MHFKLNDIEKLATEMVAKYMANGFMLALGEPMSRATFYLKKEGERKRAIEVENAYLSVGYSVVTAIRVIECYADDEYKKWHYEDLISEKVFYNLNNNSYEEGFYTDDEKEIAAVKELKIKRWESRHKEERPLRCKASDKLVRLIRQRAGYKRIKAADIVLRRTDDGYAIENSKTSKYIYVTFPNVA